MIYTINEMIGKMRALCSARYPDEKEIGDLLRHLPRAESVEEQWAGLEMVWEIARAYLHPTRFREACWRAACTVAIWPVMRLTLHWWAAAEGCEPSWAYVTNMAGWDLRGIDLASCRFMRSIRRYQIPLGDWASIPGTINHHGADLRGADLRHCIHLRDLAGVLVDDKTILPGVELEWEAATMEELISYHGWIYVPPEPHPIHRPSLIHMEAAA